MSGIEQFPRFTYDADKGQIKKIEGEEQEAEKQEKQTKKYS